MFFQEAQDLLPILQCKHTWNQAMYNIRKSQKGGAHELIFSQNGLRGEV